jgi:hypothetical protein
MTPQQKHDYNVKYYQMHKDRWPMYRQGTTFGNSGALTDDKWKADKEQMDYEIARIQQQQAQRQAEMQKDANKSTSQLFKEQIQEARRFINSKEFKKQLNQAVKLLKENSGELISLAKDFSKAFFSALKRS